MGHRPFKKPVFLQLNGIGSYRVGSAREAFKYLDHHWPAARTAEYRRAKALCRAASDGLIGTEPARRALIEVAQRAGLLVSGWKMGPDLLNVELQEQRLEPFPAPRPPHAA